MRSLQCLWAVQELDVRQQTATITSMPVCINIIGKFNSVKDQMQTTALPSCHAKTQPLVACLVEQQ